MSVITDNFYKEYRLLYSQQEIEERIKEAAVWLNDRYGKKEIVIVSIMKGALFFTVDLMRKLTMPCRLETFVCRSYHGKERKELVVEGADRLDLRGRIVVLVDDIFDSGHTFRKVAEIIEEKKPAEFCSVLMLGRKASLTGDKIPTRVLFELDSDKFVAGYGLDHNGFFRNATALYESMDPKQDLS